MQADNLDVATGPSYSVKPEYELGYEDLAGMNGLNITDGILSNMTTNLTLEDEIIYPHLGRIIAESIILGVICILTILGNLLVIVTILTNRRLKTPTNYFIFWLSVTDCLVGTLVLPFSAINTVYPRWLLGGPFCNIYTSVDVMLCTVSILTLFAISIDRYLSVTHPMKYDEKMNSRFVVIIMACVYTFSALMAFVPIHLGWNTPTGEVQNSKGREECVFELNTPYVFSISLTTYFAPLLVMCGVYFKILSITKHQVREINKLTMPSSKLSSSSNGGHPSSEQSRMVSDRKATVTLATIVFAFAVCWVPYFVLFTIKGFGIMPNPTIDLVCLWLGYVNSMINPFLYGFYNSQYRESFKKILCRSCIDPQKKYNALHKGNSVIAHRNGSAVSESSELANMKKNSTVITFMSEHANS